MLTDKSGRKDTQVKKCTGKLRVLLCVEFWSSSGTGSDRPEFPLRAEVPRKAGPSKSMHSAFLS